MHPTLLLNLAYALRDVTQKMRSTSDRVGTPP